MRDRPRTRRRTVVAGWITTGVMVLIALLYLLISSPWNDKPPHLPIPLTTTPASR